MDRRQFLQQSLAVGLLATIPHWQRAFAAQTKKIAKSKYLLSPYRTIANVNPNLPAPPDAFKLDIVTLASGEVRTIALLNEGHSVVVHPVTASEVLVLPKQGRIASRLQLKDLEALPTPLRAIDEFNFFGHGVYSSDGSTLFCTESKTYGDPGIISIRDGKDFKVLGRFDSFGNAPHEVHIADSGKTLVVAHAGAPLTAEGSQITFIDIKSGKPLGRMESTPKQAANHFAMNQSGTVVVAPTRDGDGPAVLLQGSRSLSDGKLSEIPVKNAPPGRYFQLLSVALDTHGNFAIATSQKSSQVFVFDLKNKKCIREFPYPEASGVALMPDGKHWAVTSSQLEKLDPLIVSTGTFDLATIKLPKLATDAHSLIA